MTLATFHTPEQAEPLRRRLAEENIPAWIHSNGFLGYLWLAHRPKAHVRLDVKSEDFYKSLRLLETIVSRQEAAAADIVHCPECGSARVVFPQFTQKFFLPNLIGLLSGVGVVEKKYYCEDCHHVWSPEGKKPDRRTHLAPNYFLEGVEDSASEAAEAKK
jgi:rubredoxin